MSMGAIPACIPQQETCPRPTPPPLVKAPSALKATLRPKPVRVYTPPRLLGEIKIAAVGDVIPHGAVLRSAAQANQRDASGHSTNNRGFDALFAGVRAELATADLVFANLETPISPKTGRKSIPFLFNAPPSLVSALKKIGVNLISFANNHVYDQNRRGFIESLGHLEKSGLTFAGSGRTCAQARAAKLVKVKGFNIAFVAASNLYNQRLNRGDNKPCAAELEEKRIVEEVRKARKLGANMVILSLHWGIEYQTRPRESDVGLSERLFEAGVDVILGHHPHVLQPVEVYQAKDGRICLVAYSLGNFISNQSRFFIQGLHPDPMGNPRDGAILKFSVVRKDYGNGQVKTELGRLTLQPLWTQNNALERKRDKKLPVHIRVVVDDLAALDNQRQRACASNPKQHFESKKRLELMRLRRRMAAGILGEGLVPAARSLQKKIACTSPAPKEKQKTSP
jgi:poly-gamma-glutamate synthesis protein (capsule biosynthesis protein)